MPLYSDKNLYPGVNAHLNSFLQNEPGGWQSCNSKHPPAFEKYTPEDQQRIQTLLENIRKNAALGENETGQ